MTTKGTATTTTTTTDEKATTGTEQAQTTTAKVIDPAEHAAALEELERLRRHSAEILAEKKKAVTASEAAKQEALRKAGDIEALDNSWKEKLTAAEQASQQKLDELHGWVKELTVGQTATQLASELALPGSAAVLLPHIKARLTMDIRDGKPKTIVLDENGKPSAQSIADLKKEIESNPAFAPLLVGTKASGAGGVGASGSAQTKTMKREAFDGLDQVQRMAFVRDGGKVI